MSILKKFYVENFHWGWTSALYYRNSWRFRAIKIWHSINSEYWYYFQGIHRLLYRITNSKCDKNETSHKVWIEKDSISQMQHPKKRSFNKNWKYNSFLLSFFLSFHISVSYFLHCIHLIEIFDSPFLYIKYSISIFLCYMLFRRKWMAPHKF